MIRTMTITSWATACDEADNLLDSMIEAQNANGSITWVAIQPTWAAGHVGGDSTSRVTVIDVDNTDGADIAGLTLWAAAPILESDLPIV